MINLSMVMPIPMTLVMIAHKASPTSREWVGVEEADDKVGGVRPQQGRESHLLGGAPVQVLGPRRAHPQELGRLPRPASGRVGIV
jgi:hypothetical protein